MRQVQRGQQSRAVRGTLASFVTVGLITSFRWPMERQVSCAPRASVDQMDGKGFARAGPTDFRLSRLNNAGDRNLADSVGAGRQRTRLRFRRFPSSAVQTRIDGDGQTGIQVHGPFQHQGSFAFIAGFHARTLTRVCRPDHRSEVLFDRAKDLLSKRPMGRLDPSTITKRGVS
jgi:hypothetical protein